MKKLTVLAALVLLLVVGCSKKADYWPLTVNNIWENRTITTSMINDSVTTVDTTNTSTEITQETTLDDSTAVFAIVTTIDTTHYTSYIAETDDYILSYSSKSDTIPDTSYVKALAENKSWTVTSDSVHTTTSTAIDKETVTVTADTYDDCWKIETKTTGSTALNTEYMAPNVGPVKSTYAFSFVVGTDTFKTNGVTELQSVTIK